MAPLNNWTLGPELQVNTDIFAVGGVSGIQRNSQVTALDNGKFVVVFESNAGSSGGNDVYRIHAHGFNADGTPFGEPQGMTFSFPVTQGSPAVASRGAGTGGASIVWAEGAADSDIVLMFYNPEGSLFGTFPIAADTVALINPDVAASENLNQLVVFERVTAAGNHDIQMRVLTVNGSNVKSVFNINEGTAHQGKPAIATTGNSALVVYEDATLGGSTDIRANFYSLTADQGAGAAASFLIANNTNSLEDPDVATLTDGRVVVVYRDATTGAILGRIFDPATYDPDDPTATPMPAEFTVVGDAASKPSVSATPDGGFVVVWDDLSGIDGDVSGRRFDAAGNPAGDQFQLADPENQLDGVPSVAGERVRSDLHHLGQHWKHRHRRSGLRHPGHDRQRGQRGEQRHQRSGYFQRLCHWRDHQRSWR